MKYNSNFGHLVAPCIVSFNGIAIKRSEDIELAPSQYVLEDRVIPCPSADVHAEHGNFPIIRTTTHVASEGHELVRVGWQECNGQIVGIYEDRELPPRIVRWSKRKFVLALATRKLYTRFCEWADSVEAIPGSGLTISALLGQSTFMRSDDANLTAVIGTARKLFGADIVDEILAESEDNE